MDHAQPSARVIQAAVELARAEAKLVLSHVRVTSLRALTAVLLMLVATALSQVAILLLALTPVLVTFRPWPVIAASVAIPVVAAVVAVLLALRSFKKIPQPETAPPRVDAASALHQLPRTEHAS